MSIKNRISQTQPDYLFLIVRKPKGWKPRNYFDVPPSGTIVSRVLVASYPEAHDDLVRCNRLSCKIRSKPGPSFKAPVANCERPSRTGNRRLDGLLKVQGFTKFKT